MPQVGQLGPPQSMVGSPLFCTPSLQFGTHVEPLHSLPLQSESTVQPWSGPHFLGLNPDAHEPPQSTSVSLPFWTPSAHVGTRHVFCLQTPCRQSSAASQICPGAHVAPHAPPQSMSVSSPFFVPSSHVAGTHSLAREHTWPASQSVLSRHATQAPSPSQSLPPSWAQVVPAAAGVFTCSPPVQASTVHSFPSSGRSVSSGIPLTSPPSQTFVVQSPGVCWISPHPPPAPPPPLVAVVEVVVAGVPPVPAVPPCPVLSPSHDGAIAATTVAATTPRRPPPKRFHAPMLSLPADRDAARSCARCPSSPGARVARTANCPRYPGERGSVNCAAWPRGSRGGGGPEQTPAGGPAVPRWSARQLHGAFTSCTSSTFQPAQR